MANFSRPGSSSSSSGSLRILCRAAAPFANYTSRTLANGGMVDLAELLRKLLPAAATWTAQTAKRHPHVLATPASVYTDMLVSAALSFDVLGFLLYLRLLLLAWDILAFVAVASSLSAHSHCVAGSRGANARLRSALSGRRAGDQARSVHDCAARAGATGQQRDQRQRHAHRVCAAGTKFPESSSCTLPSIPPTSGLLRH